MGFRDRAGSTCRASRRRSSRRDQSYFDKRYGPRNWSAPATTLNFAIGQGENTQTLINMVQFYAALAGDGKRPAAVRRPARSARADARPRAHAGAAGRAPHRAHRRGGAGHGARRAGSVDLAVAGKTGTAQNSHGKDHGWFIGFAPADKPEIVVGGIMEFGGARHERGALRGQGAAAGTCWVPARRRPRRPSWSCRWTARPGTSPARPDTGRSRRRSRSERPGSRR